MAQRDATTPTPNVYFYYTDQIGRIGTITKANGTPCYQATFTPYGQEMATQTACASNYKFTGYERDSETGLNYAFARYYNQRLGRFMSADPLGGDITDPQSLNRYAYVTNSPTNFSDPSGMNKCAYQGTMTFSSGSAGCTGGGGATNSNLWDSMAFGFIETYDVFQGYYVNDTSDAALWQDVAYGGGEMNYLFSFSVSEGIDGFGGFSSFGISFSNVGALKKGLRTHLTQECAALFGGIDEASSLITQADILDVRGPIDTVQAANNMGYPGVANGSYAAGVSYSTAFQGGPWDGESYTIFVGQMFQGYTFDQQLTAIFHEMEHAAHAGIQGTGPGVDSQQDIDTIAADCATAKIPVGH